MLFFETKIIKYNKYLVFYTSLAQVQPKEVYPYSLLCVFASGARLLRNLKVLSGLVL